MKKTNHRNNDREVLSQFSWLNTGRNQSFCSDNIVAQSEPERRKVRKKRRSEKTVKPTMEVRQGNDESDINELRIWVANCGKTQMINHFIHTVVKFL